MLTAHLLRNCSSALMILHQNWKTLIKLQLRAKTQPDILDVIFPNNCHTRNKSFLQMEIKRILLQQLKAPHIYPHGFHWFFKVFHGHPQVFSPSLHLQKEYYFGLLKFFLMDWGFALVLDNCAVFKTQQRKTLFNKSSYFIHALCTYIYAVQPCSDTGAVS